MVEKTGTFCPVEQCRSLKTGGLDDKNDIQAEKGVMSLETDAKLIQKSYKNPFRTAAKLMPNSCQSDGKPLTQQPYLVSISSYSQTKSQHLKNV